MESSNHKVNPGLLVTPTHAEGIKLAAVSVTSKTQRTKHVVAWLTRKPGQYFAAWRVWAFRGSVRPDATLVPPLQAYLRASPHRIHSPGQELKQELGERLASVDCGSALIRRLYSIVLPADGKGSLTPFPKD